MSKLKVDTISPLKAAVVTFKGDLEVTGSLTIGTALVVGTSQGTAGQVLTSQGNGKLPIWSNQHGTMPFGGIIVWSGSISSIPGGWLLCDGTKGTPNLSGRFVLGAVNAGNSALFVGASGGSASSVAPHTHTIYDSGHSHKFIADGKIGSTLTEGELLRVYGIKKLQKISDGGSTGSGDLYIFNTSSERTGMTINNAGTKDGNLPPYYVLCYIMKGI